MVITIELEGGVRLDLVQSTNSVDEEIIKEFQRQSLEMNEELQASSRLIITLRKSLSELIYFQGKCMRRLVLKLPIKERRWTKSRIWPR